ncbi:MAG: diguanylate cyclase, partial [Meiothermus silvanus]|nr:diguanylate cyclase [Allomeiothermus silvanus]
MQTGLPNKRYWLDRADDVVAEARRRNVPVAFLQCRLDPFDLIHAEYGETQSSQILGYLVDSLKMTLRVEED